MVTGAASAPAGIANAVQQAREITLGARHEQWPVVLRRACDDGTEHLFGVVQPPRKAQGHGEDSQVLRLEDAVVPLTVDRQRFLGFSDGKLGLTLSEPDL